MVHGPHDAGIAGGVGADPAAGDGGPRPGQAGQAARLRQALPPRQRQHRVRQGDRGQGGAPQLIHPLEYIHVM